MVIVEAMRASPRRGLGADRGEPRTGQYCLSEKHDSCYLWEDGLDKFARVGPRRGLGGVENGKNLEADFLSLQRRQAFEITQNRQGIVWKCLEKKGGYLEMFGGKNWGLGRSEKANIDINIFNMI